MYIIQVIPLSRTAPPEPLTYRSRSALIAGTLVEISLRKKTVLGLVVASESVQQAKSELKLANFSITKSVLTERGTLPPALRTAAQAIARYHATSVGAVMASVVAPIIPEEVPTRLDHGEGFAIETLEGPRTRREEVYEKHISTDSVTLLVVPTLAEARAYGKRFHTHKPLTITSAVSQKKRDEAIARACSTDAPSLIICTPSYSFLPIPHLSRIIIERISAGGYVFPKRPYIDMRIGLTELAQAREIPITYGDYPLPLEYRGKPAQPIKHVAETKVQILDARELREEGTKWLAVPDPVRKEMARVLAKNGTIGVLAARRGYAPSVVCKDCGTAVTDEYGRTLSLSIANNTRVFRSADGRTIENIDGKKILCAKCGSWNLQPLGIGIERVGEELRAAFPDTELIHIDKDTASAKLQKQLSTPPETGRIIIGTEAMLPCLSPETPLTLGIIASADSLLAVPFWRSRERFVRVGLMLAERSQRLFVVTRRSEDTALSAISDPTTSTFWEEELGLRKLLQYPPFGSLIVFHIEGSSERIAEAQKYILEVCAPHTVVVLPTRAISKTTLKGTVVLQLPKGTWPDPVLSQKLAVLPPFVRTLVDPETFF